jgi:arylsulfatase A-like enzyme
VNADRAALAFSAFAACGLLVTGLIASGVRPAAVVSKLQGRPNILMIDVDTWSWDHVSVPTNGISNTPNFDTIASRGVKFTHAFAHSGWTGPSIHTLLTGQLPVPTTGTDSSVQWRAKGARDLPEILGYYGYHSEVFWGVTFGNEMGNAKHFDRAWQGPPPRPNAAPSDTEPPTYQVLDFLKSKHDAPFFAYVHEVDLDRAKLFSTFPEGDPLALPVLWQQNNTYRQVYRLLQQMMTPEAAQTAIKTHYDMMVSTYDQRLGAIMTALKDAGLEDNTIVVVTSDHGNDFFEHAVADHGLLYDSTIRVPLVVVDPRRPNPGATVDTVVQTVDIAPTLLAAADVPVDILMAGSPLPTLAGEAEGGYQARPVFSLSDTCHVSWRDGDYKLILRDSLAGTRDWYPLDSTSSRAVSLASVVAAQSLDLPMPDCTTVTPAPEQPATQTPLDLVYLELYDLKNDPGERTNIAVAQPETVARLLKPLLETLAQRVAAGKGGVQEAMTAEQVARLKEQGYWGFIQKEAAPSETDTEP